MMKNHADVAVIGAGAAGLTAAIFAAKKAKRSVLLLERTDKAGKKILMSGGTRCNVLPVVMEFNDFFTSSSPNLMKRIFRSWDLDRCKIWFEEEIGLKLACEAASNKWFPQSNSAKDVRDLLQQKALAAGVDIRYNQGVSQLEPDSNGWKMITESGETFTAGKIIVSTGGYSIPTTGTDGLGHQFLEKLGVPISPVYPALTPLEGPHPGDASLAGVSLDAGMEVHQNGKVLYRANRSGFLFTHHGFSGPAVLDVSHFLIRDPASGQPKPDLVVNWTGMDAARWSDILQSGRGLISQTVAEYLPARLAQALCTEAGASGRTHADIRKEERKNLIGLLTSYLLNITGDEGYKKAEVTGGGVPLEAIDTASMQCRDFPGIYLCGEILDVFGRIGGFNFYWAWVTGRLAGMSV